MDDFSKLMNSLQHLSSKFDSFATSVTAKIDKIEGNYEELAAKIKTDDTINLSPPQIQMNVSTGSFGNEELTRFNLPK